MPSTGTEQNQALNVWGLNLQATCRLLSLTAELTGQWVQQTRMTPHGACAQCLSRGPFTKVSLRYGQGCGWAGEGRKWLISVLGLCILGPEKNPLIVRRLIFPIFRMPQNLRESPLWLIRSGASKLFIYFFVSWVPTILWNINKKQYTTGFRNDVFKNFKDVTNDNGSDRIIMYNFIKVLCHEGCVC